MYGSRYRRVRLDDLIAFAWSAPMRELAATLRMSDVGLKKSLVKHGVVCPPQGYWNKIKAGRKVPDRPRALPRRPGERPYLTLFDWDIAGLPEAPLPSPDGPFETPAVPEDLEALRALEARQIGKSVSARTMTSPHKDIAYLLQKDELLKERNAASRWGFSADPLLFESPFERRRLRVLNAIFRTLEKRGHSGSASRRDRHVDFSVRIGDTALSLQLIEAGKRAPTVYDRVTPHPKRSAAVRLELLLSSLGEPGKTIWRDTDHAKIEDHISEICVDLIVAGEAAYRADLRRIAEIEERSRVAAEQRAEEARRQEEQARVKNLLRSGKLLARAEHLRSVISRVEAAVVAGNVDISEEALAEWRDWANGQADAIDPIKSGQIRTHLTR